jgi:hypothetical protein
MNQTLCKELPGHNKSFWAFVPGTMRCINDHNQFVVDDEWEDNPYNIAQGGPCTAQLSFLRTVLNFFIKKEDVFGFVAASPRQRRYVDAVASLF